MAHLQLLTQLRPALLSQLALPRLEDGLGHRKIAHLPLLHQLLYRCLQHSAPLKHAAATDWSVDMTTT